MSKNNRQARSEATQQSLMRAAEKLVADRGLENVTVRAIIEQSGQKNESALQYHFNNKAGLLRAIHQQRMSQIEEKRSELLDTLLANNTKLSIREICTLMVEPSFHLAKSDAGFRQYVKAFSHELATSDFPTYEKQVTAESRGTKETRRLLRESLGHLNEKIFQLRFDSAVRFVSISMSMQARKKNAFQNAEAEIFFNTLVDAMAGLLAAEVSANTKRSLQGAA